MAKNFEETFFNDKLLTEKKREITCFSPCKDREKNELSNGFCFIKIGQEMREEIEVEVTPNYHCSYGALARPL